VKIVLTSRVTYEPFSPEFLANPIVQSLVAECQRKGEAHCGERLVPADSRTEFVRTQDKRIVSFVELGGVEPGRAYEVRFRLFDPAGNLRERATFSLHVPSSFPPNATLIYEYSWAPQDPATWQLGRWRLEIAVNGQVESEGTFEVVDRAR
jgi:hypothetical protein